MVSDVVEYINSDYFDPNHVQYVTIKIAKNCDTLTVKHLTEFCRKLENNMKLPEGSFSPADSGKSGCLLLACVMPVHCCLYAYEMLKLNSFFFRKWHIQFIQIESFPKIFSLPLADIAKELPAPSTFTST